MFNNIRWRIAIPYVILILTAMGGLSLYLSRATREAALEELQANLQIEARAVVEDIRPVLADLQQPDTGEEAAALQASAERWSHLLSARVTIIDPEGNVVAESHTDPTILENHLRRPEIQEAMVSGQGSNTRFSQTLQATMMYAALPVELDGELIGFARVALPIDNVEARITNLRSTIFTAALLTTIFAILLAIVIAERTARPLRRLTQVAQRMAEGDLDARLFVSSSDEVGELTRAFNHMGEQLREKVHTLGEERGRLASVLELMADGVLITDDDGRVQLINPAAAELLNTSQSEALGKSFAQVVRHYQFIELWQRCRDTGQEQVEAVEVGAQDMFVHAIVTPLPAGQPGCLIILQNLTPIRRLQTVRRDFISNISHELRTPLASLKALVETLRDVALDDPSAAEHFLDRAEEEVDDLTQMVQELLELSRIESGKVPLRLSPTALSDAILPPLERLRPQIERNALTLLIDVPPDAPSVLVDAERIAQVITNLVHNAIKFTPPNGIIRVSADVRPQEDDIVVSISDTGVGIRAQDQPRIFERFYKADRARSGGGTGLGLAIVRHLVQAHGGAIWVESQEGEGSTFYFTLPLARKNSATGNSS